MDSKKKWKFVEWKFHKNWQKTFVPEDGNSDWLGDYALIPKKENTTYLTFNEWLPLYNADPSSWFIANYKWSDAKNHICPVCVMKEKLQKKNNSKYIVSEEYQYNPIKKKYQIILFTNRWNYWKWKRFMTKKITRQKEAKESIDNLKEYQMLVQYAQKRADERVAESQKQLQAAIDENVRLIGKATKEALNSNNDIIIPTTWNFQRMKGWCDMSEHCGYVVKIDKIEPHFNADRLQIVDIFGASVIVDLSTKQGDLGVYFPVDLQLSEEYCAQNNLVRKLDENGNNIGGYLEPNKRNIRAMKLRGAKSEGLFMPLESLGYTGVTKFEIGDKIEILNGHEICRKYIPRGRKNGGSAKGGNRVRKRNVVIAPLFAEHADTEQLAYNLDAFKPGDQIEITLKMHGTSGRTGYLPKLMRYKRSLWDKIFKREGTPVYDWGYVTGTRRVVLEDFDIAGGFYGDNKFREPHARIFEGKLWKGETVYYEIVGFTNTGTPIMSSVPNSRVNDKEFTKMYGKETVFSYGCEPCGVETVEDCGEYLIEKEVPQSDMYVYRMTMTNEDGDVVEYTPDFMRYRCAQMGVKTVPILWSGFLDPDVVNELGMINPDNENEIITIPNAAGQWIKDTAEEYYDGPDPIGKTHVREGVVVRIVNRPKFTAYKHKNFSFKCLEGIAKDIAEAPDMEEAQEVVEDEV